MKESRKRSAYPERTRVQASAGPSAVSIGPPAYGIESIDHNALKPAQLQALAHTQGIQSHVASEQERHSSTGSGRPAPHQAWHIVQRKQGRVQPTMQMKQGMISQISMPVIQRVLAAAPTVAADRATMNGLPGALPNDMGNTGSPAGYTVPAYNINTVLTPGGWVASVVQTAVADPGANYSRYLGAGIHSTGLMLMHGALTNYVAGPNSKEIYGEVTGPIANQNRDAEQEHVDDFLRAYAITLDVADQAIAAAVAASPFPAQPSMVAAQGVAETFMNNSIAMQTGALGANAFLITAALGTVYDNACQLSMQRDGNGWHTFRPNTAAESSSMAAWAHWVYHLGQHEVRLIQQAGTFSVGVMPSATLIV